MNRWINIKKVFPNEIPNPIEENSFSDISKSWVETTKIDKAKPASKGMDHML